MKQDREQQQQQQQQQQQKQRKKKQIQKDDDDDTVLTEITQESRLNDKEFEFECTLIDDGDDEHDNTNGYTYITNTMKKRRIMI